MPELRVEATRSGVVESVHRVSVAVADATGRVVAASGDPALVTWWRSAAKPFQALPMVADGAWDRFGFDEEALALACASHSSEPVHVALARRMLGRLGLGEEALACGPHVPLSPRIAEQVVRGELDFTSACSNCSGKHAGMLALCLHLGWALAGYERAEHPLQQRVLDEVARWTGVPRDAVRLGTDGCTATCFGLPLAAMATAYARFAAASEPSAVRVREAMMRHPYLVAGEGRPCTDLMAAGRGAVFAKVGADGVYCAGLPGAGLGVALKVEDGDMRASPMALLAVLEALPARDLPALAAALADPGVRRHRELVIRTTRGVPIGALRAAGSLRFSAAPGAAAVPVTTGG